jgi:hypothetical protein
MNGRRRPAAALVLIAMVSVISACGASASPSAGTGSSGGNNIPSTAQKAVKFARCMRGNGVSRFPDPSASGKLTIDAVANGSSLDTNTPAFTQAMRACKNLEPAGFTGGRRSSAQQSAALTFARCIRANGVTDFPDPGNGQPLIDTNRIPSAATSSGMSILKAAMQKCHGVAAAAGVTR